MGIFAIIYSLGAAFTAGLTIGLINDFRPGHLWGGFLVGLIWPISLPGVIWANEAE